MLTKEEILQFIQDDSISEKKKSAKVGLDYYEGRHDIRNYKLYYVNNDEELVEDTSRSNIKISHPFFTELVDQQVQYMLSNDDEIIKSDDPDLQNYLNEVFDDNFKAELEEVLTGTISKGFEYMYAYKNKEGKLAFQCADSLGVVEVEGKYTSDGKNYTIYHYVERINKDKQKVKRIQVWDDTQVYYYTQVGNEGIELDKEDRENGFYNPRPHVLYHKTNDDNTYYEGLGFVPFFRLDNNRKKISGLSPIKALIDDYDLMACGLSNNIQDASEYVLVVTGFDGDDVDKIQKNIKTKKAIGIGETSGTFDFKTVSIPYDARKVKLELDEKNIYRFGMGFNSAQIGDGNITNIVIKSRYALLDLKCNKLEIKLKQFLRKIIQIVLESINKEHKTDYQMKDVYFDFEREVITNASDNATIEKTQAEIEQIRINTLKALEVTLGSEKVLELICDILDIDYEDIKANVPVKDDLEEFINVGNTDEQMAS